MTKNDPELLQILTKIYETTGLDFTQYKEKSVLRRINSRMLKHEVTSYSDYTKILDKNPDEYNELINSLTINVTEFFRNPESFNAIEKIVIPRVIFSKRKHKHKIIRAWSCGCATGDEPYSLAMLLLEKLGKARENFLLTIIGSDVDKKTLEEAKETTYSLHNFKAINAVLLDKHFDKIDDNTYKLKSCISNLVRFRRHDVIRDNPFFHCDIILCRNLLIYFNKQLQEEILLKFYECLNPGGFLVLGMTETLAGSAADAFTHTNNSLRIYQRPEKQDINTQETNASILSQNNIDAIVNDMLGREEH